MTPSDGSIGERVPFKVQLSCGTSGSNADEEGGRRRALWAQSPHLPGLQGAQDLGAAGRWSSLKLQQSAPGVCSSELDVCLFSFLCHFPIKLLQ